MNALLKNAPCFVLVTALCLWAAPALAEEEAPAQVDSEAAPMAEMPVEEAPARTGWIKGSAVFDLDAATARDDEDIDLYQRLRLDIAPAEWQKLSFSTSMWVHEDLDSDESANSALRDINDSYGGDVNARLLHMYLQADNLWGQSTLRLGRQRVIEGPVFNRIDGLYFKQYRTHWDWYVYGGARASLYDDSHDDLSAGGGLAFNASTNTRLGLDFMYADDHRDGNRRIRNPIARLRYRFFSHYRYFDKEVDDTLVALSLWHDFTPNVRLFTRYTLNDGDNDELLLDLTGYYAPWDVSYEVMYRRLLDRIGDRVNDLSGFYRILGPEEEYQHFLFSVHKPLNEKVTLSLEAEVHDSKAADAYTGNRDYTRLAAIVSTENLIPGINLSLATEYWDVDDGDGLWALTGEVRKEWDRLELFAGADFERYRDELIEYNAVPGLIRQTAFFFVPGVFTRFTPLVRLIDSPEVRTRQNIYSFYTGVKWAIEENQDLRAKLSYENDDRPESPYWRFQASYEIRF